ncbi:MAG: glycosyltransferase [Deltaproteobacteria bacterium]|nr:glycosyltransferase [Deltaproteobacteria bacterium]MBW2046348.1 glycosyltransferase [Deltaproteobacteria bacterium]MBW2301674.1 glycosyltransferase [Deltaproteobacteria bacterium]
MSSATCGLLINYREPLRTNPCVDSLLADGINHVLVWDNSADDGVSARQLLDQWGKDSCVTVHISPANLGFAAGVNRGIERLLGRHPGARILLINNDARLLPGAVDQLNAALDQNPKAAIAYPRIDHNGRILGTAYYQRHVGLLSFDRPFPGSFPYAIGCVLMIAPERIELPLFDDDFFMYGEDVLLGWRLGPTGMAFVPRVLAHHEGSASSGLGSPFYETRLVASHWILARKLANNRPELGLLMMGRAVTLTLRALVRTLRYRNLTPIKALRRGWRIAHGNDRLHPQCGSGKPAL